MGNAPLPEVNQRDRDIRFILVAVLVLNLGVALAKLGYGWLTQSLSMQADGFHSLFDGISNVMGLIGMTLAAHPPDRLHPYGHKKFETLASAGIAVMLIGTCGYVGWRGIQAFFHPQIPHVTGFSFGIMLVTMAINAGVTTWEQRRGKALQSEILIADSYHTASDLLVSFSVLVSLAAVRFGFPLADPIIALIIAAVIAWTAFSIIREVTHSLADQIRLDPKEVKPVVLQVPGVLHCHSIRTRGLAHHIFIDLSIQVEKGLPIEQAHAIAHDVEDQLKGHFEGIEDVVVHLEPDGH
ncbi:cation diffusion facilitator family transporter [Candidatus Nitronereus thalassa]|uniref:Cation diffusion facilitator family transporter n=1 Tax=Candidatus Nitronereus thalassa TaxID=3020898 RepID=A0ABU3K8X4_9BACT|nr:cation diffusion facilitator family transporter [Candidatus Nitronereus thalassa]MDT7042819.1 cation diffusion facilitator family transporter [Candidatus Nitronereus thalassa]